MKTILSSQAMDIPEGITVEVEGPRGKLTRDFKHVNLDFAVLEGGKKLKVEAWLGSRKTIAAIRTAISHVWNLIAGVTKSYRYKMRLVYAHFPISNNNTSIEIRNFLGEKKVRKVDLLEGVKIFRSEKVKDELILDGNGLGQPEMPREEQGSSWTVFTSARREQLLKKSSRFAASRKSV